MSTPPINIPAPNYISRAPAQGRVISPARRPGEKALIEGDDSPVRSLKANLEARKMEGFQAPPATGTTLKTERSSKAEGPKRRSALTEELRLFEAKQHQTSALTLALLQQDARGNAIKI